MLTEINKNPEFNFENEINNVDEILDMTPRMLADFMNEVEVQGQMEAFLKHAVQSDTLVAQLSYWEKWFPEAIRKKIDEQVAKHRQSQEKRPEALPLDLDQKFTPEELHILFSSKGAFQLTFGCSKGCKHCGFDAVPGVRDEMDFKEMKNLFKRYGKEAGGAKWMLYYASEPSDSKRYPDYHGLMEKYGHYSPEIITAEGQKEDWTDYLVKNTRLNVLMSLPEEGKHGYGRLNKASEHVETIMFDGKPINIAMHTSRGIRGHIERKDHMKNIGISYSPDYAERDKNEDQGIGCIEGALITPRGLYNVASVPISEAFPQGQVVVPIREISEEPIEIGQHLKDILRTGIINGTTRQVGYPDRLHIQTIVHRKNANYIIRTDKDGFVAEVRELRPGEEREIFPRTEDKKELEAIYEKKKEKALLEAKVDSEELDVEEVYRVILNNPSLLHFDSIFPGGTNQNIQIISWQGVISVPGSSVEYSVELDYKYSQKRDIGRSRYGYIDEAQREQPVLSIKKIKNSPNEEPGLAEERRLAEYLEGNILHLLKEGVIHSYSNKPFNYQRLLENIAKMNFSQLRYQYEYTNGRTGETGKSLSGKFPESLYEGQSDECKKEKQKDKITIDIGSKGEFRLTID